MKTDKNYYVAQGAVITGSTVIGEDSSVWYNTVIRADSAPVTIGKRTNIQDLVMIHTSQNHPVILGDDVTVGHSAIIHGCTIGAHTIVGMGSIIMDGAAVGKNCMIGAGSLITQEKIFPDGSLIMGSPAKLIRALTDEEIQALHTSAPLYVKEAEEQLL